MKAGKGTWYICSLIMHIIHSEDLSKLSKVTSLLRFDKLERPTVTGMQPALNNQTEALRCKLIPGKL